MCRKIIQHKYLLITYTVTHARTLEHENIIFSLTLSNFKGLIQPHYR